MIYASSRIVSLSLVYLEKQNIATGETSHSDQNYDLPCDLLSRVDTRDAEHLKRIPPSLLKHQSKSMTLMLMDQLVKVTPRVMGNLVA